MAVYIWSFIYLPLGNAFWITLFIPQTKFLCLYWLCNLKTKGVDAIFWYLVNQIQTSAAEHVHMEIDMIVSVDSKWWYVIMIYLEDSVHYGVFWCPCDIMNIVVFIKKKCGQHVKTLICEDKIDLIFWQLQVLLQLLFQNKNNFVYWSISIDTSK